MIKNPEIVAPKAKQIAKELKMHNDVRIDNYFWMNDRENPEVISYLNEENAYTDETLKHTSAFQGRLFEEMKLRIKEDDTSVPYKYNGYWYITKYEKGKDYPIYTRKKDTLEAPEELLFDCNEMAKNHSYFRLVGISISSDNKKVAFGIDTTGRRQYNIHVKDIYTNEILVKDILNTTGSSTWANDNNTIFFTKKDEQTLRAHQIYKLNISSKTEHLCYEEKDDTFGVTVYKTKSKAFIIIACYSTLTNAYLILNANTPQNDFELFCERKKGLEYSVSHYKNKFYILTNLDNAFNFKLMDCNINQRAIEHWNEVIPHKDTVLLESIDLFKNYLVISERTNGLNQIRITTWDGATDYYLPFNNETYTAYTTTNIEFDSEWLRYAYNSLTTPASVIEFNMATKQQRILKEQEVLGGTFNKENYTSERIWATAHDGKKIPISLVYKKGITLNGKNPLLQYAYGSYGSTVDPYFSTIRLSLLDRGFIYAIAHVRGGEYMGRQWYEDGKLLNKTNTFTDFIACSKHLISEKYTSKKHLYASGGSAGGLLIGAVINEAPDLYNGVIAAVPFVDVVTTMLDDTIPLTTGEYDEWGNPNNLEYYKYMKSYSPYDNVMPLNYPNILITAGLHDSQVQYWEPAKWAAKLRTYNTGNNMVLLRTNMDAGHGGASGRFESLKEDAEEYAFLLDLENISQ